MRLIRNSQHQRQVARRQIQPALQPPHIPLSKRDSHRSSGRTNVSTWAEPLLVGGSQQMLLQRVLSQQLAMSLIVLCFLISEAGLAEQILRTPSETNMRELPHTCKRNTPSRQGAGGSNCTFQRQRDTFPFPQPLCFPLLG